MKRYRVYGHTMITVTTEVVADSEKKAYEKATKELSGLMSFSGNGGTDKLVGVCGDEDTVSADEGIEYDDIEFIREVNEADEKEEEAE